MIEKINAIRKNLLFWLVFAVVAGIGGEYILFNYFQNSEYFIWYAIGIGIVAFASAGWITAAYKSAYDEIIVKPIVEKYGIKYFPDNGMDENLALSSGILPDYDRYSSSFLIEGRDFQAAKIILEVEKEDTDDEGNTQTYYETVFDGVLIVYFSNKEVSKYFVITNNHFHISDFLPIFNDSDRKKLDDVEFEKYFDVYYGDDIEVRKILTHDIMRKLVELKKEVNFSEISFLQNLRFISVKYLSPVRYPWIFLRIDEKRINESLGGIYVIMVIVDFFEKNGL